MPKTRLTEAQVEAGESYLKGSRDRKVSALWSKVRGRLRGEERWRALVDLSVREALLASVEDQDPYVLYELAREAVDRMEPWLRVRLQRDLNELLREGAHVGVPLGTEEAVTRPEAVPLVHLLATQEAWLRLQEEVEEGVNERTWLRPEAKERLDLPSHKVTDLLKVLERDGAIRRWTERVRSGGLGRPREVRKVALTPQGKAYLATFWGPQLGPGSIRNQRYVPPRPVSETALQQVRDVWHEVFLKRVGLWPAVQFRWLEGDLTASSGV